MKTISIIIPAYNESRTIEKLVETVYNVKFNNLKKEIICIDDNSPNDNTWELIQKLSKKYKITGLHNDVNLKKSQTVKKGILLCKGDIVVVQDADLETDPNDLIPMADMILNDEADAVFGNRYSREKKNNVSLSNYFGNKFLTFVSNLFTMFRGLIVPDMEVCYKMMRGDVMRDIAKDITAKTNIGIEPEVTARVAKYRLNGKRLRVKFVPMWYYPRSVAEGKTVKIFSDGWKAIKEIIHYNLFSK